MSIPKPPGYTPMSTQEVMQKNADLYYPRRPQIWVPPAIMLSSFAAGYAIPWNLGTDPQQAFFRFVLPLLVSAGLCCAASFFAYQTNKSWRIWSWAAFGFQTITFLVMWLFPVLLVPRLVLILLFISVILLGIASGLGAEKLSEAHRK
jgi:hypothetical protein